MRVLLMSVYDLGHQPLRLADAAARLRSDGHQVETVDISVNPWPDELIGSVDAVALSVPMHTAARLAADAARRVRSVRPSIPVAFYGLYAEIVDPTLAARRIAGEYVDELADWCRTPITTATSRHLAVAPSQMPDRSTLTEPSEYPRLEIGDTTRLVAYAEASRGCIHRCTHCPVPVIYDGRIRVNDVEIVMADIDAQVAAGATHVTFGDPDFFNGVGHTRRVIEALRSRHPGISFDATIKVEHILRHADMWPLMAEAGCLFVISAFETTNERILALLDKGHTGADMDDAIDLLRRHGIEIRPSWLPFTPWTTVADLVSIFRFIDRHDLIANTDAVQLSIRLLIPPGSLMLDLPEMGPHLGDYDAERLTYEWTGVDPAADMLQRHLARIAAHAAEEAASPTDTFMQMWHAVNDASGELGDPPAIPAGATAGRPRMQEPWFC